MPLLLSNRSTCLTACLVTKPLACARAWPIIATASDADCITPGVAPVNDPIRLACRSAPYNSPMNERTSTNFACPRSDAPMSLLQPTTGSSVYRTRPYRAQTSGHENEGIHEGEF